MQPPDDGNATAAAATPPDAPLRDGADWQDVCAAALWPPARVRCIALLVLLGCAAPLVVAAFLKPDARGWGTHQQLGLAPCGMIAAFHIPCPTCGMTTAFAYAVRMQWLSAIRAQAGGFALAVTAMIGVLLSLRALITGAPPRALGTFLTPFRLFLALLIVLIAGWGIKLAAGFADGSLPIASHRIF